MTLSTGPWWWAPVFAFGWMTTVPAQSFSAPVRALVMAAARFMPGVCAVLASSSLPLTTRTPSNFHFPLMAVSTPLCGGEIISLPTRALQPGAGRARLAGPRLLLERLRNGQRFRLEDCPADAVGHAHGVISDPSDSLLLRLGAARLALAPVALLHPRARGGFPRRGSSVGAATARSCLEERVLRVQRRFAQRVAVHQEAPLPVRYLAAGGFELLGAVPDARVVRLSKARRKGRAIPEGRGDEVMASSGGWRQRGFAGFQQFFQYPLLGCVFDQPHRGDHVLRLDAAP